MGPGDDCTLSLIRSSAGSAIGGMYHGGGGIVIPCTYKIYGNVEDRDEVRNALTKPYTVNDVKR